MVPGDRCLSQRVLQRHAALAHAHARHALGRIVNVSSVAARAGMRGQTNAAAAKAGLHGSTKALALELANRGITFNAVAPGIIESAMTESVFSRDAIEKFVPMKRAGTP